MYRLQDINSQSSVAVVLGREDHQNKSSDGRFVLGTISKELKRTYKVSDVLNSPDRTSRMTTKKKKWAWTEDNPISN